MHAADFASPAVARLREDLALALRAAAHHGLAEGVCNHFSVELPDGSGRFLLNPRGLLWSEVGPTTSSWSTRNGKRARGPAPGRADGDVHPRRRPPHRPQGLRPAHAHAVRDGADADRRPRPRPRRCRRTRCASTAGSPSTRTTTAWPSTPPKASASPAPCGGADVAFLGNHGVVVCGERIDHAYDDLYYLERACMVQVLAQSTGRPLAPVDAPLAARVRDQTLGERLQSELFFEALRRTLT